MPPPGSFLCPACSSVHGHNAHQVPAPLSHPGCRAFRGDRTQRSLGSFGLRAEEVLSSRLLTPPPSAGIYRYLMALHSPSSNPSAVLGAVWGREAVTGPAVTGVRPRGHQFSPFSLLRPRHFPSPWLPVLSSPSVLPGLRGNDLTSCRSKRLLSHF